MKPFGYHKCISIAHNENVLNCDMLPKERRIYLEELNLYKEQNMKDVLSEYSDMVYKIAYSQTKNQHHAEDVFQEVFLRLIKKKPSFQSKDHLKAWLIRVTINCSKSIFLSFHFKKRAELSNDIADSNVILEKSELYYAVMNLPNKYKNVLYLFYYEGYSIKEIATILDKKEATIKTNLHRGRNLLKVNLKGVDDVERR